MRNIILGMSAFALAAVATPRSLKRQPGPSPFRSATVVSDYRFRGIADRQALCSSGASPSLTRSGLYASVWGNSIDEYVAGASDQEIDLIAGLPRTVGAATFDVGVLY